MAANGVRLTGEHAWIARYMPVPFVEEGRGFRGADCRGLHYLILEHETGVRVPDLAEVVADRVGDERRSPRACAELVKAHAARWRRIEPAPDGGYPRFCLLLFTIASLPTHVGTSMGGRLFIHTQKGCGVRPASLDEAEAGEGFWGSRLEGAYQYGG